MTKLPDVEGYKLHCIEASGITESSAKKLQSGEDIASPDMATKVGEQRITTPTLINVDLQLFFLSATSSASSSG